MRICINRIYRKGSIWLVRCLVFSQVTTFMSLTMAQERDLTIVQQTPNIDTHIHLDGFYFSNGSWQTDFEAAAMTALETMNKTGVQKMLFLPPPFTPEKASSPVWYDYSTLKSVVDINPDRFGFIGGGGSLSPLILTAIDAGEITASIRTDFRMKAEEIVAAGALGFGEIAAEHLSFFEDHPYVSFPPDHPLLILLADIAAENNLPIDLHMEAVEYDIPLPVGFANPPNPDSLKENISAFERLLSYNREAAIVWVHIGWDNTGHMTVELLRRLLEAHTNLYMSLKLLDRPGVQFAVNRPVHNNGTIRSEWLQLFSDFPDRFVVGSDEFFGIPGPTPDRPPSTAATWNLIAQLPDSLVRKIGNENAERLYGVKTTTSVNQGQENIPSDFVLHQNFPNPFNPETRIVYNLPKPGHVKLTVYNVVGKKIVTLVNDQQPTGRHTSAWNGKDEDGNPIASGLYFYIIHTHGFQQARKLTLMQ